MQISNGDIPCDAPIIKALIFLHGWVGGGGTSGGGVGGGGRVGGGGVDW